MYKYLEVAKTPSVLEDGIVYVNVEFELASMNCACGCGHKIVLLCPDGHTVVNDGGFATIVPSIGVWDSPCRSHFFVTRGEVDWSNSWSEERIKSSMRAQRERHIVPAKLPWWRRLISGLVRFLGL